MSIENFVSHIPEWSANINYRNQTVYVSNTCTIDYFLLAYWVLNKIKPSYIEVMSDVELHTRLKKIVGYIEIFD